MTTLGIIITATLTIGIVGWLHLAWPQFAVPLGILLLAADERWSWIPLYLLALAVLTAVGVAWAVWDERRNPPPRPNSFTFEIDGEKFTTPGW